MNSLKLFLLKFRILIVIFFSYLMVFACIAQEITAESFVRADIEAMEVSKKGVERRLELLAKGASFKEQTTLDDQNREEVDLIYQSIGLSGPGKLRWETKHKDEIEEFLSKNFEYERQYQKITSEIEALSSQIRAVQDITKEKGHE